MPTEQSADDSDVDFYLQKLEQIASEEKLAGSKREGGNQEDEPPAKKQKVVEEVIAKAPVPERDIKERFGNAASVIYPSVQAPVIIPQRDIHKEAPGHVFAPQIPLISEIPLPVGYPVGRVTSDGISAGRPLAQVNPQQYVAPKHSFSQPNSNRPSTSQTPTPAPFNPAHQQVVYHLKQAGEEWSDASLGEWDPNDFRIFVGDLGNEVTDDMLKQAFNKYPSFLKSKVVFDKKTKKPKGYGFVSFGDPKDYLRVMKEMQNQYIGNRPVKLRKGKWKDRIDFEKMQKEQEEQAEANRKSKPKRQQII